MRRNQRAARTLEALANPTRVDILDLIAGGTAITATQLADRLPITRQGVQRHLDVLNNADLIAFARADGETRYRIRTNTLHVLSRSLGAWAHTLERKVTLAKHRRSR